MGLALFPGSHTLEWDSPRYIFTFRESLGTRLARAVETLLSLGARPSKIGLCSEAGSGESEHSWHCAAIQVARIHAAIAHAHKHRSLAATAMTAILLGKVPIAG